MTIANVAVGTKVTATKGNEIINEVNAHETELAALDALVHARTDAIGTRNGHTYNPGQVVANGGACQFDVEYWRSGINAAEDFSGWTVTTPGVYAISWGCEIASSWYTTLVIEGVTRSRAVQDGSWSYGQYVARLIDTDDIVVRAWGPTAPTAYLGGFIDIFRLGIGG